MYPNIAYACPSVLFLQYCCRTHQIDKHNVPAPLTLVKNFFKIWFYTMAYKVFTFCFTISKCFCNLAVRKHWAKEFRFVATRAKLMLCYDNFKCPHYLSFFCCFIFHKRENGCLFRAAAWSIFSLSCCKCCFSVESWFGRHC